MSITLNYVKQNGDVQYIWNDNSLRKKNKVTVNLKNGRFDNINSAVIISTVRTVVKSEYCLAFTADDDS